MPHEIRVPRLGWSMEEGVFLGWCKQPGEQVAVGEPLFELEGEKAAQAIESLDAGELYIPPDSPRPGCVVPVGQLLGYLLVAEEPIPRRPTTPGSSSSDSAPQAPAGRAADAPSAAVPAAGPAVRRLARQMGVDLNEVTRAAMGGRIQREHVVEYSESWYEASARHEVEAVGEGSSVIHRGSGGVKRIASPRAKRVAAETGIDWTVLRGTGRGGRIREADVRAAEANRQESVPPKRRRSLAESGGAPSVRRATIAARLRRSLERTIPVTLTTVADVSHLVALRGQFQASRAAIVPSYTDLAMCLMAKVIRRHPRFAVRREPDEDRLIPIAEDGLDIGLAVDTPDGLLVPILRDVASKSLIRVARESKALIERARSGRLTTAEMEGGVITITSLGGLGIDAFTPIINYPEIAILGMGVIRREPVVLPDDRIVPRDRMTLSLTFDHAVVDGAPAAAFLRDIAATLENGAAHLLDGGDDQR